MKLRMALLQGARSLVIVAQVQPAPANPLSPHRGMMLLSLLGRQSGVAISTFEFEAQSKLPHHALIHPIASAHPPLAET